jgi:hypothetical protein
MGAALFHWHRDKPAPLDAQERTPSGVLRNRSQIEGLIAISRQTPEGQGRITMKVSQIIAIRRSITARAAVSGETVAPAPKAPKAKRVMSEKQALTWNTIIRPSLEAGRAAKKAAREALAAEAAVETPVAA